MSLSVFSIGILFNALVNSIVTFVSLALLLFLWRRWHRLDDAMRAFGWFCWFTVIVWFFSTYRNILLGFGYTGWSVRVSDYMVQSAVFFTGIPLFYYAARHVFKNPVIAERLAMLSFGMGCVAVWFVLQPDGIPVLDVTFFSADATINSRSFIVFSIEASAILALLLYDVVTRFQRWRQAHDATAYYEAFYSTAIIVYLVLGSIDESKVIPDWPLIGFRLLYSGAFLMAYLTLRQQEASREEYLVDQTKKESVYA